MEQQIPQHFLIISHVADCDDPTESDVSEIPLKVMC